MYWPERRRTTWSNKRAAKTASVWEEGKHISLARSQRVQEYTLQFNELRSFSNHADGGRKHLGTGDLGRLPCLHWQLVRQPSSQQVSLRMRACLYGWCKARKQITPLLQWRCSKWLASRPRHQRMVWTLHWLALNMGVDPGGIPPAQSLTLKTLQPGHSGGSRRGLRMPECQGHPGSSGEWRVSNRRILTYKKLVRPE